MPSNSIFWQIYRGDLPAPNIATVLNAKTTAVDENAKTLTVAFNIDNRFCNATGHIQGGIIAAMLDAVMGPCNGMVLADNQFAPTLNINVEFIHPAKPGQFIGKAKVVHQGRSICFLQGELFDRQNQLIAIATATTKVLTLTRK